MAISNIELPKKDLDSVMNSMNEFRNDSLIKRKNELGYSHKTTYMFEGMWGSGKTKLIKSLASYYNRDMYVIPIQKELDDYILMDSIKKIHTPAFLVFEDIDALFEQRERKCSGALTFSGLLNTLDGIMSHNGLEIFITTNYIHKLDSALIRPGRIDFILNFTYAIEEQIKKMFKRITTATNEETNYFYDKFNELNTNITMAEFQQFLLPYIDNPMAATENIYKLKNYR